MVREKAQVALNKVAAILSDESIKNIYMQLIKRLKRGDVFSMRIAACALYADIYERLGPEERASVHKKMGKLGEDDTPMVRWGAAQAISVLVQNMTSVQICEHILPLLMRLLNDKNDSVRVHAVQSSVNVVKFVKEISMIQEHILPALKQAQ